jgi:hypothetical protein
LASHAISHWGALAGAFGNCPALELRQTWRTAPEAGFAPGSVRIGSLKGNLAFFADLTDHDPFNPVVGFNEPAFLRGDVLEIFLQPGRNPGGPYIEIHVTPGGSVLQLAWRTNAIKDPVCKADDDPWRHRKVAQRICDIRARVTAHGWQALVILPLSFVLRSLGCSPIFKPGFWRFSVSRYDYTRGKPAPVLSSTSCHRRLAFHRTTEWNELFCRLSHKDYETNAIAT